MTTPAWCVAFRHALVPAPGLCAGTEPRLKRPFSRAPLSTSPIATDIARCPVDRCGLRVDLRDERHRVACEGAARRRRRRAPVDARSREIQRRLEPLVLVAALLVIPA